MAYDEGVAEVVREDLGEMELREIAMFGGLCFMLRGNMLCGVMAEGGLYRVGKENMEAALWLPHCEPMEMKGRTMGGFVVAGPDLMADDAGRRRLLHMALSFVESLPAK